MPPFPPIKSQIADWRWFTTVSGTLKSHEDYYNRAIGELGRMPVVLRNEAKAFLQNIYLNVQFVEMYRDASYGYDYRIEAPE